MIKLRFLLILLFLSVFTLAAQETAVTYFDKLSQFYGTIKDYQGKITIAKGDTVQTADIYYKSPNLLRLDFTDEKSKGIVMNSDGKILQLFLPEHSVSFSQTLAKHSDSQVASMANSQGLHLMKQNYKIGYRSGPDPVPLDTGKDEMVVKLRLDWLSPSEGFRELELSVSENMVIRRIRATTTKYEIIQFDFLNLVINEDIPDTKFYYDPPPVGNKIENFLFEPEV